MSSKRFRQIALKLAGATEGAHGGHPDFRINGRIFATLSYPADQRGMVVLTPEQQAMLVDAEPEIFRPVPGGWGKGGSTNVNLTASDPVTLKSALTMAWTNRIAKGGVKKSVSKKTVATSPSARKTAAKTTTARKAKAKKTSTKKIGPKSRKTNNKTRTKTVR